VTLRILLDECCPHSLQAELESIGHDAIHWANLGAGARDEAVLTYAFAQARILITLDNDFGELVVRQGAVALGGGYRRRGRSSVGAGRQNACSVSRLREFTPEPHYNRRRSPIETASH